MPSFPSLFLSLLSIASLSIPALSHPHIGRSLSGGGSWFHEDEHPVHDLFGRQAPGGNGQYFPPIGTPEWSAGFPTGIPDITQTPLLWFAALDRAVSAGKIPNISLSDAGPAGLDNPVYPPGNDPGSPSICSASYGCRNPRDIYDAPPGLFGTGFDDGPQPPSGRLLQFLAQHNEKATHFVIGSNILKYPGLFKAAFDQGNDIAVHTYSHRHMTSLSNYDVVAELGWTMQLIRNSTGGRVPKFWRPPFGDSDNRVRAIAEEVFGLKTIIWNRDTYDWRLTLGDTTPQMINGSMTTWLTGPKAPGLIVLTHELSDQAVQAFIDAYPLLKATGWRTLPVTQIVDGPSAYQNANGLGPVRPKGILVGNITLPSSFSAPPKPSSTTSFISRSTTTTVLVQATTSSVDSTPTQSSSPSSQSNGSSRSLPIGFTARTLFTICGIVLLLL